MLKEVLPLVKKLGVQKVLLTPTNLASQKVVEACGGKYESGTLDGEALGKGLRYWIWVD